MDQKILASLFQSRKAYDAIKDHVAKDEFGVDGTIVYRHIKYYYENDTEAESVDKDIILDKIEREHPKHFDLFRDLLADLTGTVSVANVMENYIEHKQYHIGLKLAAALQGGGGDVDSLLTSYAHWNEFEFDEEEDEELFIGAGLEVLTEAFDRANVIPLYPQELNNRLDGGVLPGTHVLFFARPEVGKSLIGGINLAAKLCRDGRRVLYIGNEDPTKQMLMRFLTSLTGMMKHEVLGDPEGAYKAAIEYGYENLILKGMTPGTFYEIRKMVEVHKPEVVIIDQLRNIDVREQNRVLALEKAATEARKLGKQFGVVVVSITQAGDSATNKLLLEMGDVDYSNTGIPSQCDLMIGIGCNDDFAANNHRMLSLPKNKISGDHSPCKISIDPTTSRVLE